MAKNKKKAKAAVAKRKKKNKARLQRQQAVSAIKPVSPKTRFIKPSNNIVNNNLIIDGIWGPKPLNFVESQNDFKLPLNNSKLRDIYGPELPPHHSGKSKTYFKSNTFEAIKRFTSNRTKLAKGLLFGGVGLVGIAMAGIATNQVSKYVNRNEKLPSKYSEGYKEMTSYVSDFGSPVNLLKTVSKTINKNTSSTRHGIITNTRAITNSNLALYMNRNAINHHRM